MVKDGYAFLRDAHSSADSQAAMTTVDRLRATRPRDRWRGRQVGGGTPSTSTSSGASRHDRKLIIPLVLVVVFIILALLLRAIVAPLLLIAPWCCPSGPPWASAA